MSKLVIPQIFRETVKKYPAKRSLARKDPATGEYAFISYKELEAKVNKFASSLLDFGVQPGDKIALSGIR